MAIPLLISALGGMGLLGAGRYAQDAYNDYRAQKSADKVAGLLGEPGQYQLPPDQAGPQIQGTGLLGGALDNKAFAAKLMAIPGYENLGARLFENEQQAANQMRASDRPYFTPIQTSSGFYSYDNRTGKADPLLLDGGLPVLPVSADPAVQANITAARTAAEERARSTTKAAAELPKTIASAEQTLDLIDKAIAHPGRGVGTGISSVIDPRNYIPGTEAKNFGVLMDQLQGKAFLEAFESLKGAGQITEMEGKKALAAIARLNTAQSDNEFVKSLTELRGIVASGIARSQQRAGGSQTTAEPKKRLKYNPATGRIE